MNDRLVIVVYSLRRDPIMNFNNFMQIRKLPCLRPDSGVPS